MALNLVLLLLPQMLRLQVCGWGHCMTMVLWMLCVVLLAKHGDALLSSSTWEVEGEGARAQSCLLCEFETSLAYLPPSLKTQTTTATN